MIDSPTTAGERLCSLVFTRLVDRADWAGLYRTLGLTVRGENYVELCKEIITVNVTCRVVALGRTLAEDRSTEDPLFVGEYRRALREAIGIPADDISLVLRNAVLAVRASQIDFTVRERERLRAGARARNSACYMCGVVLDFVNDTYQAYSLEHIWPQAFGGDSIDENVLPACKSCNGKKSGFCTWGMVAVQSLVLGLVPSAERLDEIDKTFKFALHQRAARQLANQRRYSMAEAFVALGAWKNIEVIESDDVAHFFNLSNIG